MPLAADRDANTTPAYLLGRLWAHLHDLETAATGDTLGVIGYSKWASTITTPTNALGHHATYAPVWEARLRRQGQGHVVDQIAGRIGELLARIGEPGNLAGIDASSWFGLGYHHQRAANKRDAATVSGQAGLVDA